MHRVQRQVRQLDYERKGYTEELRSTLNRQQNTLEGLRKANDALQDDLKLLKSLLESQKKTGVSSKKAELLKEQSGMTGNDRCLNIHAHANLYH